MEFTAHQISELLGGTVEGNPEVKVSTLAKIEEGRPGALSFLGNPLYTPYIYTTAASLVIVNNDFLADKPVAATLIRVPNAHVSFAKLLEIYNTIQLDKKGVEDTACIDPSASIGTGVYIGGLAYIGKNVKIGNRAKIYPHCYIGDNTVIGDDTTMFAGVKIYSDCLVGNHCTIHAGSVIGSDGFGFQPNADNNYQKVPQIGNVIVEDHVDIGANCAIDRATLGSTIIRKGAKLDNLVHIAHNVEIGSNTVIAAQVGFAGSSKLGKGVMIGGQAGIAGHLVIADGVKIAGQSGVGSNVTKAGEIIQGSPSFNIGEYRRSYVLFRKLPELEKKIAELEKTVAALRDTANS